MTQKQGGNSPSYSNEAKQFLIEQANNLSENDQYCTLVTFGPHTSYNGSIEEVADGGIVFNELGTGRVVMTPWESVEKLIALPQGAKGELTTGATAGK